MNKEQLLKYALVAFGLIFVFGVYPLMYHLWPAGWRWQPGQTEYEEMIIGVYFVLGLFLIFAAKAPRRHLSLIWFTVWSSLVHGGIMAWQAAVDAAEHGHFFGDVPALILTAVVLGTLTRGLQAEA